MVPQVTFLELSLRRIARWCSVYWDTSFSPIGYFCSTWPACVHSSQSCITQTLKNGSTRFEILKVEWDLESVVRISINLSIGLNHFRLVTENAIQMKPRFSRPSKLWGLGLELSVLFGHWIVTFAQDLSIVDLGRCCFVVKEKESGGGGTAISAWHGGQQTVMLPEGLSDVFCPKRSWGVENKPSDRPEVVQNKEDTKQMLTLVTHTTLFLVPWQWCSIYAFISSYFWLILTSTSQYIPRRQISLYFGSSCLHPKLLRFSILNRTEASWHQTTKKRKTPL